MSPKPKDHRPKIFSFRTSLDGLNIAAREDILWPCHAFSISIPRKKKMGLNIFEETVLKLTEIESGDTETIAGIACLFDRDQDGKEITDENGKTKTELVSFIQNRLYNLGLVDKRYEITETGRELIESKKSNSEENLEYTVATMFVDLLSGKLLPYISTEPLVSKKIVRISNSGSVAFLINPTDRKSKHARQIRPNANSYWNTVPETSDIIRAIREYKKKYKRHSLLNQGFEQSPPPVPMAEAISVHDDPELVFLHCNIVIQVGNSNLLVTDGSGLGFSESFADYLISQNLKWVVDLKKKGVIETIEGKDSAEAIKNPKWKFPEVTRKFNFDSDDGKTLGIYSLFHSCTATPRTSSEEKNYVGRRQQLVSKLYAAFEWSLRYALDKYPVEDWEQIFKAQSFKDNENLLCGFAQKIGLLVSEKNRSILQVKAGAIRQIEYGKVELQPLLALAISGAAAKYSEHPFHDLGNNHLGFLDIASELKSLRDPIEHGDISDFKLDQDSLNDLLQRVVEIILILLPTIALELKQSTSSVPDSRFNVNQDRLKSEIELEKVFGFAFYSTISSEIKEQLHRCEIMFINFCDDKAMKIITGLSSVVQLALLEVIIDRKLSAIADGDIKKAALRKIVESGFYSSVDDIPEIIRTVGVSRLYHTIHGSSSTLGAHLLAVFFLGSVSELVQLRNSNSTFIGVVANLLSLRGHGNEQLHDFSRDDLESLKADVFKTIKIIPEVF